MTDNNSNRMVKHSGQVFTPDFLVISILDYAGYTQGNILQKHVIDNSCGDGAFLCEITNRYCCDFIALHDSTNGLKEELEQYIHGIELDPIAYENCLYNLTTIASEHGVEDVKWNVLNTSALSVTQYNGVMDYVIGNPPYVRVHNLEDDYEEVKSFSFAQDGMTDLYYRMVMPVGFNPSVKYPTIVYVYGGPHAHNVDARWHYASRGWETYMAQKGYLLFILDNRGSENRGRAFEQATFRQLGQIEMQDQMMGIEYLKSLPYVDSTRIGVHGWSFGGFMTTSLMTNYPDVFKVGVAGGPVIDWKWYEVMYGERYMDTPESNPEGYAQTSLIGKAKNLKGKLQIIIGLNDPVVVPQHALSFIKECILQGTQPDFFVYPGEPHNMRGHQSTHLHERISQYFDDYLK